MSTKSKRTTKQAGKKPRFITALIKKGKQLLKVSIVVLFVIVVGFLIPDPYVNPVRGATAADWNPKSFWYYPWGRSGVHRGVDIFGKKHQPVVSATYGIVINTQKRTLGGNTATVLGPKWRLHYYAHLNRTDTHVGALVYPGKAIGSLGDSGNALGKAPHVHYSIRTLFPYVWQRDQAHHGSIKMWYIDPTPRL